MEHFMSVLLNGPFLGLFSFNLGIETLFNHQKVNARYRIIGYKQSGSRVKHFISTLPKVQLVKTWTKMSKYV